MRMKNWKWPTILFVQVIVFFSCAGQPPALKPYDRTIERAPSPATAIRDNLKAPSDRSNPKPLGSVDPSGPPVRTPNDVPTAQPSAGDSRDLQSASATPPHASAKPGAAPGPAYSDYRTKVLPTKWDKQASGESALGEDGKDYVELNFDNADVNEVIAAIAGLTGIKYMVDPGIAGQVTIHTAGEITRDNLLSVFYLILEANGLTAVKDGGFL